MIVILGPNSLAVLKLATTFCLDRFFILVVLTLWVKEHDIFLNAHV